MALSLENGKIMLSWSALVEVSQDIFPGAQAQAQVDASKADWLANQIWSGGMDAKNSLGFSVASASTEAEACLRKHGVAVLTVSAWEGPVIAQTRLRYCRIDCKCELADPKKLKKAVSKRMLDCWGSDAEVEGMDMEFLAFHLFHVSNSRPYDPLESGFFCKELRGGSSTQAQWQSMLDAMEIERALSLKAMADKKSPAGPRI